MKLIYIIYYIYFCDTSFKKRITNYLNYFITFHLTLFTMFFNKNKNKTYLFFSLIFFILILYIYFLNQNNIDVLPISNQPSSDCLTNLNENFKSSGDYAIESEVTDNNNKNNLR